MTIDQLLADVSPVLPMRPVVASATIPGLNEKQEVIAIACDYSQPGHSGGCVGLVSPTSQATELDLVAAQYLVHAANHFPAMLRALREIAYHDDCNGRIDAEEIAKQALAAAEVVK